MASNIEHQRDEPENLSIDPIYDTNWCDMPAEIKLECIGKMEFRERLLLRCTAKAERSLVDSQKIKFCKGSFWGDEDDFIFVLHRGNKYSYTKSLKDINASFELIKYIKKVGVFENLNISFRDLFIRNEHFMKDGSLFETKNIEFEYCNIDNMIAVLRNLKDGVESIKMDIIGNEFHDFLPDETFEITQVQNVPYWHIKCFGQSDSLHKVAQMWINKNSNIGSTFQVTVQEDGPFEEFLEYFTDRIISKSEKRVRIRTENPDRHILLERGLDETVTIYWLIQFFRMMVIPAEMKESEYDDNCKEWICKMDSHVYDSDSSENSSDGLNDFYDDDYEDSDSYGAHSYDSENDSDP